MLPKHVNPYDFANAITDPTVFAGRRRELDEAKHYLDLARSQRPISLAVIGDRASGKTLLLNMIDVAAKERGFVVFRLDLDESITSSRTQFFRELFESALQAACEAGLYSDEGCGGDGTRGRVYQTARMLMDAGMVPDDPSWVRFQLPLQIAQALNAGRLADLHLPWATLSRDFQALTEDLVSAGISQGMVGVLDEANLLGNDRSILETLRNLLQRMQSMMLVLAGTKGLFPVMHEVFSPIARQFKFLELGPFDDLTQTRECVELPLRKIGVEQPMYCFDHATLKELDRLAGSSPYEVRLVCHMMYREASSRGESEMSLTKQVLDSVFAELDAVHGTSKGRVRDDLDGLSDQQLHALYGCLRPADLPLEQVAAWSLATEGPIPSAADALPKAKAMRSACEYLRGRGLLECDDSLQERAFPGGDLGDIYLKYYAEARDVQSHRQPQKGQHWVVARMLELARQRGVDAFGSRAFLSILPWGAVGAFYDDVLLVASEIEAERYCYSDDDDPVLCHLVATGCLFPGKSSRPIARVSVDGRSPIGSRELYVVSDIPDEAEAQGVLQAFGADLDARLRAVDLGWSSMGIVSETVVPFPVMCEVLGDSAAADIAPLALMECIWALHDGRRYIELKTALSVLRRHEQDDWGWSNNLAYVHLALGEWQDAVSHAEAAVGSSKGAVLPRYNLAVATLMGGDCRRAAAELEALATAACVEAPEQGNFAHCLFVPGWREGGWQLFELHCDADDANLLVVEVAALARALVTARDGVVDPDAVARCLDSGVPALASFLPLVDQLCPGRRRQCLLISASTTSLHDERAGGAGNSDAVARWSET